MYRAFPFTVGVAALQATLRLHLGVFGFKRVIDFHKLGFADFQRFLFWVLPVLGDEPEIVS
jgi:hypothetical protein